MNWDPSHLPVEAYSPECVEWVFSEVRSNK